MSGEESLIGLLNCACCATLHGPPKRMWASWSDVQIHTCAPWLELSCRSIIQDISRLHSHPIEDEQPPTYESQSFAQQKLLSIVSICVFLDNIFPPAIAFYPVCHFNEIIIIIVIVPGYHCVITYVQSSDGWRGLESQNTWSLPPRHEHFAQPDSNH